MMDMTVGTHDLAAKDRFSFWQEVTGQMVAPVETRSQHADDFHASARLINLGAVQISVVSCPAYEARRTKRMIRCSDPELYQLSFNQRSRSGMSQARREITLGHRDLVLYDTSQPFRGWAVPDRDVAEGMLVAFPRHLLPQHDDGIDIPTPLELSGTTAIGALLSEFLVQLVHCADQLGPGDRARLSTVLLDLLGAQLAQRADRERGVPPESRRRVLLMEIHAFVERQLGDPRLTPATIASANHISTRYLHKLFEHEDMTVSAWVRERRLARCRRDLADPSQQSTPVQAIAARWGFTDAAAFSRTFRAAHGVSPTDYRRVAQMRPPDAAIDSPNGPPSLGRAERRSPRLPNRR
jgi:AraC-like DNA-binding protein